MLRRIFLTLGLGAILLSAEDSAAISIYPPPAPTFDELKQYLVLSDAQVEQLRQIQTQKDQESQAIVQQISTKHRELQTLLQGAAPNAAQVGQLMIDIQALQKRLPLSGEPWRPRALAVLTPDQRTRLGALDQANKLQIPAGQAVWLDLIDPPPAGRPVPLDLVSGTGA